MKMLWATDIHLDCCTDSERNDFIQKIANTSKDCVLITGDIGLGTTIIDELSWLSKNIDVPVYFVLGNHDYYGSNIKSVRAMVSTWNKEHTTSYWLDETDCIQLSPTCYLVGDGGWGDARNGDFLKTPIRLNDHQQIKDLTGLERTTLQQKLQTLGTESKLRLEQKLRPLLGTPHSQDIQEIVVATHVPPFPEAAWYLGHSGAVDWIPDFTCQAIGDLLLRLSSEHPKILWTVLCGHGHHAGIANMRDNLIVRTGAAVYGAPAISNVFDIN